MQIREQWDKLHFFKKDLVKPTCSTVMYVVVPYFDMVGNVRGYVAADTLRMKADQVQVISR